MRTLIVLSALLCYLSLPLPATAQKSRASKQVPETIGTQVRIAKDKPHVFVSYERRGKIAPLYAGESDERIWLRFHNNSKWQVMFCSGTVPQEYGETEAIYELERYKGSGETPGTSSSDNCAYLLLKSGDSVQFSVPREHLADGLALKIQFRYQWESDPDGSENLLEPKHYVYFYSEDIPKQ